MNTTDPFNRPEAKAIRIQFQALTADFITVASFCLGIGDKLPSTLNAKVILFATSMAILADVLRTALRTLHRHPQMFLHPPIMQRPKHF